MGMLIFHLCQVYKRFCDNGKITTPITPEEMHKHSHTHTHICLEPKRHIENGQQNRITMWKWAVEPTKLRKTKYKSDPRNGISSGKFTMSFVHREIAHSSFGIRFGPIKHLFSQRRENQMIW